MEFFKTVEARVSIRAYLAKPVEESKVEKVLHAACLAPSAGNFQAYRIIVVKGKKERGEIAAASSNGQKFIVDAPICLAFATDATRNTKYGKRGEELYCVQDATIAASYAQLAAAALGLGTVWVGSFDLEKVAKTLKLKPHEKPVILLPLGYPAEEREGHERRKLDELASRIE